MTMQAFFSYFGPGEVRWAGKPADYLRWVVDVQLRDADLWRHFVEVFRTRPDVGDRGWRGEYWGKMMRGACLAYAHLGDAALYQVLEGAVTDLLGAQDALGRFSTYDVEHEFSGWDVWARKYVMTGLQHFYDICPDAALRARIVDALRRHADYIVAKIGDAPGQKKITETSNCWLGVNSASILEPFVRLHQMTGDDRYLAFARHILSTGGCTGGDLVALALEDRLRPFEYPETKAYETMSFFEGVLAYYETTGEARCLEAVLKFVEAVYASDITIIGCAGCTHELFDHSAAKQTEPGETIMQETCVTVTWMRLLARLLVLTGDARYAARISQSAWNALYGTLNFDLIDQTDLHSGERVKGLPFDSYSPLYNDRRGRGIGGFKRFADTYYGCCACIAAAGVALFPRTAALRLADGFAVNELLAGEIATRTPGGQPVRLVAAGTWPAAADYTLRIALARPEKFRLLIRLPAAARQLRVRVAGKSAEAAPGGYLVLDRVWSDGDTVEVAAALPLEEISLNGRTAFRRGALVLARDAAKEGGAPDLAAPVGLVRRGGAPLWREAEPQGLEIVRLCLQTRDGAELPLTDYASCGKRWNEDVACITVWMNVAEAPAAAGGQEKKQ